MLSCCFFCKQNNISNLNYLPIVYPVFKTAFTCPVSPEEMTSPKNDQETFALNLNLFPIQSGAFVILSGSYSSLSLHRLFQLFLTPFNIFDLVIR